MGIAGGILPALVADVGAAVVGSVGVENFFVKTGARDADDVSFADHGSGVQDYDEEVIGIRAEAEERQNTVVAVVAVNPFETLPVEVHLVESRFGGHGVIQVFDQFLDALV